MMYSDGGKNRQQSQDDEHERQQGAQTRPRRLRPEPQPETAGRRGDERQARSAISRRSKL